MKLLLYAAFCSTVFYYGCDKSHQYLDPSKEPRLSVEFLIPPSIGSPYKVGDILFVHLVITTNNDSVHHADVVFRGGSTILKAVGIDSLKARSIPNDKLWNTQYLIAIWDTIPPAWAKRFITIAATANNATVIDSIFVE